MKLEIVHFARVRIWRFQLFEDFQKVSGFFCDMLPIMI